MDDIVIYDKPVDRVRAFIVTYARERFGIDNASALAPLVELAFDDSVRASDRIRAASELLRYSEVPTRSIEYDSGKSGPDFSLTILGACEIQEPEIGKRVDHTKQLVSEASSDSVVELHDAGREAGGERVAPEGGEG